MYNFSYEEIILKRMYFEFECILKRHKPLVVKAIKRIIFYKGHFVLTFILYYILSTNFHLGSRQARRLRKEHELHGLARILQVRMQKRLLFGRAVLSRRMQRHAFR